MLLLLKDVETILINSMLNKNQLCPSQGRLVQICLKFVLTLIPFDLVKLHQNKAVDEK
jgi:hypothetical protein